MIRMLKYPLLHMGMTRAADLLDKYRYNYSYVYYRGFHGADPMKE
jgi:hypothetical protein